jgi:hypothetical protein
MDGRFIEIFGENSVDGVSKAIAESVSHTSSRDDGCGRSGQYIFLAKK